MLSKDMYLFIYYKSITEEYSISMSGMAEILLSVYLTTPVFG